MSFLNHTNDRSRFSTSSATNETEKSASDAIEINDKELFIKQVFRTDPSKGCELLFKRYYGPLCSHAVKYVYSKAMAEDMVAEVFYKFWENKYYKQVSGSYRSYLFKAVRNTALNLVKKEFGRYGNQENDINDCSEQAPAGQNIAQLMEAEELSKLIEKTIRELPPRCQHVFLLSRLESRKNMEIARHLNVSVKAVEAHISKALGILRSAIQEMNI